MKYEYSENTLVQDSAAALMHDELGWDVIYAYNTEVLDENGTLGRKDYHEIVLKRYFKQALKKLNTWTTDAQLVDAIRRFLKFFVFVFLAHEGLDDADGGDVLRNAGV